MHQLSPSFGGKHNQHGRDDGIRTHDLLVPNQARYQATPHPESILFYSFNRQMKTRKQFAQFLMYQGYGTSLTFGYLHLIVSSAALNLQST